MLIFERSLELGEACVPEEIKTALLRQALFDQAADL